MPAEGIELQMPEQGERFQVLDGWRGLSITFVLAAHLLPLGPHRWQLNVASGQLGMALFFTLSGFLITRFLLHRPNVVDFVIRRLSRILPLAWLCMAIVLIWADSPVSTWLANFFFYANWPPMRLLEFSGHFWSLCVEMQFYFAVALIFLCLGRRGLLLLPVLCLAITALRMADQVHAAINTYYRGDELLAGCILALASEGIWGDRWVRTLGALNPYALMVLLAVASHPDGGFMNYLRPYLAALLVGWTLHNGHATPARVLTASRVLAYLAAISYALYVIHPLLMQTWLGSGLGWEKYAKRPLLFGALFLLAHASTYYFERPCIAFGKRLAEAVGGYRRRAESPP